MVLTSRSVCGCIRRDRANKGLVHSFLCLLVAGLKLAPEKTECLIGFVGDSIDVGTSVHVIVDDDA